MLLYSVVGGEEEQKVLAIFSTRERALTFAEERGVKNALIHESSLPAGYEYPSTVYAAHEPQSGEGALQFTGLFIDQDEARAAVGKTGKVLTLKPDLKHTEDIH